MCTNVSSTILSALVFILSLLLSLYLTCRLICLYEVQCVVDGRRLIFRRNIFRQRMSCLRLCHIISFGRDRAFVRRLFQLGAIDVCSKSEAAPELSVVKMPVGRRLIAAVEGQMRADGHEEDVCRVAGEWSVISDGCQRDGNVKDRNAVNIVRSLKVSNVNEER